MVTCVFSFGSGYTSAISEAISPPQISLISIAALFSTFTVAEISVPFSKCAAASVLNPCRKEVLRMLIASKQALSKKIFFVVTVTPLCKPPNTPAIQIPSLPSHIIRSSALSFLSFSSRVTNGVPSGKVFTIIFFSFIASASKA